MNHLDLFSGIGGFHLGLEMAGFHFDWVGYSDIDPYANKVYAKNFPDAVPLGDITKIDPKKLPGIDIVTAGFPCQDISVAGKQKGMKDGETRSGLFYEIIRLCGVVRPRIIFLENVSNLINGNDGEWMRAVLTALAEIGYDAEWEIIRASDVGAPHRRARVWIVAYPTSERFNHGSDRISTRTDKKEGEYLAKDKQDRERQGVRVNKVCEDVTNTKCSPGPGRNNRSILPQDNGTQGKGRYSTFWSTDRELSKMGKGGDTILSEQLPPPEICGMDDGLHFQLDRLKCLGNAVVPQCVELVGRMILESGLI